MDLRHFDHITRQIGAGLPRRGLLGWLAALLLAVRFWLEDPETAEARGRRKRRKKRHKHGRARRRRKRNQRRRNRRKRKKQSSGCQPGQPCGEPGQICQVDRACACEATSCPECQVCDPASGLCVPNPDVVGDLCGEPIQVCQSDGTCACPETVCGGVCGCPDGSICDSGTCELCDVTFDGDAISSGATLQDRLDEGGTVRVCPGRYEHRYELSASVTVIGAGDGDDAETSTILDGGGSGRTLFVENGADVSLQGVRITGGSANLGAGVRNNGGLTLTSCTISGNVASELGGGIYAANNASGSLKLIDCRVTENTAVRGGGLDNNAISAITISRCSFTKNRSGSQGGGGIYNNSGTIHITNSQIIGNETEDNGGGVYNGTSVTTDPGNVTFDATTRVENNEAVTGGGIYNEGNVSLNGAVVTGNTPNNCDGDPVVGCINPP
jgi:predicted outer membrane repeat protein